MPFAGCLRQHRIGRSAAQDRCERRPVGQLISFAANLAKETRGFTLAQTGKLGVIAPVGLFSKKIKSLD